MAKAKTQTADPPYAKVGRPQVPPQVRLKERQQLSSLEPRGRTFDEVAQLLDLDGLTDGRIRFRCGASGSRAHCTSAQHARRGWRATLRASPWCRCTLESGDDVVILEGEAVEVSDQSTLKKLDAASRANYKMPLMLAPGSVLYCVRPKIALAWTEKKSFPMRRAGNSAQVDVALWERIFEPSRRV